MRPFQVGSRASLEAIPRLILPAHCLAPITPHTKVGAMS
jgi:hypothetical protein